MKIPATFRPLLKPISFLLHDHRFLIAILTMIAFTVSSNIPQLANQQQAVLTGLLALATLLIGGYSFDSLTASVKGAPTSLQDAEQQALNAGLNDIITYTGATGTLTATPIAVPTTSATVATSSTTVTTSATADTAAAEAKG